jgi:biopolymer transport protein ExbB
MTNLRCRSRILASLIALLFLCALPVAFGQTAAPMPSVTGGSSDAMSFNQIMHTGGGVMYVLAFASVLTLALVVYFLVVIRVGYVVPKSLYRNVLEKVTSGADLDEIQRVCEDTACPLSMIVVTAIDYVKSSGSKMKPEALKDIMEGEGARQSDEIQGRAQYLLDIAVLSPMLGLLGTVVGMLQAFNAVALENSVAKPVLLAGGVSKALVATAFGLIVGIPAMAFYGHFRRKASKVVSNLEVASLQVYTALTSRSSK